MAGWILGAIKHLPPSPLCHEFGAENSECQAAVLEMSYSWPQVGGCAGFSVAYELRGAPLLVSRKTKRPCVAKGAQVAVLARSVRRCVQLFTTQKHIFWIIWRFEKYAIYCVPAFSCLPVSAYCMFSSDGECDMTVTADKMRVFKMSCNCRLPALPGAFSLCAISRDAQLSPSCTGSMWWMDR